MDSSTSSTPTIGTLKCKVCKKDQVKSLKIHTCNIASLEEYEAYVKVQFEPRVNFCQICEKKLCNDSYLKVHLEKMHGIRPKVAATGTLKCKICQTGSLRSLGDHKCNINSLEEYEAIVAVRGPPRANYCEICEKGLCNDQYFKVHLLKMHGVRGRHYCQVCEKDLSSESNLNYHMRKLHGVDGTVTITKIAEDDHGGATQEATSEMGQDIPVDFPGLNAEEFVIDPLENMNAIVKEEIMLPELFIPDNFGSLFN